MNKKTLIICIAALAILLALLAGAVSVLYSDTGKSKGGTGSRDLPASYSLLEAVPSDAAMILSSSRLEDVLSTLTDTASVFGCLFDDGAVPAFRNLVVGLDSSASRSLRSCPAVVSMHYSGELTPLMIINTGADAGGFASDVMAVADSVRITCKSVDCSGFEGLRLQRSNLLLISSSETLVAASQRHLDEGVSVLDKEGVIELGARLGGKDAVFISNEYAGKLFTSHVQRAFYDYSPFFRRYAQWTGFSLEERSDKGLKMGVESSQPEDPSFIANMVESLPAGESKAVDILPSNTVFAVSVMTPDLVTYLDLYKSWLDASGRLEPYRQAQVRDSLGFTPEEAALRLNVKEVVKASVRVDGGLRNMVGILPGKADAQLIFGNGSQNGLKDNEGRILPWGRASQVKALFGGLFSSPDIDSFVYKDGWIIASDRGTLEWMENFGPQSLRDYMSDAGASSRLPKTASALVYFSPAEFPPQLGNTFKAPLAASFRKTLEGISYEPMIISMNGASGTMTVDRIAVVKTDNPVVAEKDTVVEVPKGPFKVPNSQTGRTNIFGQSDNLTLTLKEEDGKGIWGIPFSARLCGYVEPIDYYANGKLQYLFAAGSKLYLIDRLGRFVGGFPVELGKEVLLGPGVYDFTGAHGYSAMILHKDNSLVLYDLHGRVREGWNGIEAEETVKSLPELLEIKGKKYWVVRTSVRTQIYGFGGGQPLIQAEGGRMIRPDSPIEVKDNGSVSVTCYDGKDRTFKLQEKD